MTNISLKLVNSLTQCYTVARICCWDNIYISNMFLVLWTTVLTTQKTCILRTLYVHIHNNTVYSKVPQLHYNDFIKVLLLCFHWSGRKGKVFRSLTSYTNGSQLLRRATSWSRAYVDTMEMPQQRIEGRERFKVLLHKCGYLYSKQEQNCECGTDTMQHLRQCRLLKQVCTAADLDV